MNFKKVAAFACAATIAVGAAGLAGCGIFGKGRPKTITVNGFSVKLSTKYDKVNVSYTGIVGENVIIGYDSDDILFSVAQIPREDIDIYHVYDLSTFTTFIMEDCYGATEDVYEFKSEDGSLDGNTFAMYYTNSDGYRNVQTDYLFAGTKYFYEVSLVTLRDDYTKLKDDIESIVLSCSAEDGLNESADIKTKEVECGKLKFNLNECYGYDKEEGGYTNGVVYSSAYCEKDAKFLTLDGLLNYYRFESEDYASKAVDAKTVNGTKFAYIEGKDEANDKNSLDWLYFIALYIDSDGAGYFVEFDLPDYEYSDRYIEDIKDFMCSATGGIDDYKTGLTAGEKTFEDTAIKQGFGYTLTLDDTYFDYGWSDATEDFMLYSPEYDRYVYISKCSETTVQDAYKAWQKLAAEKSYRVSYTEGDMIVGVTYTYVNAQRREYEVALFVQVDDCVFVVTYGSALGYFNKTPFRADLNKLDKCDQLFVNALIKDGKCDIFTVD